jgi:hypothetical protein
MKNIQASTLAAQNKYIIDLIEKIILYEQYPGKIKIVTLDAITVEGNAMSYFTNGNYCIFPLFKFDAEYLVSSVSYNSSNDETTINIQAIIGELPEVNTYIAKKIDITNKLTMDGISSIASAIEGRYLGEFDSGSMTFSVSNGDGYFQTRQKTGLFDRGNQIWVKYTIKLKGTDDTINYFGGLISLTNIEPDIYNKTLTITVFGHSYELSRYPAYDLYNEGEGYFPKIGGIIIAGFTPSADSEEGIKQVSFTPFKEAKMNGISLESVSINTRPGVKRFEFHYPNQFRWDNGEWLTLSENPIPNSDPTNPEHIPSPPEYDNCPEIGKIKLYDYDGEEDGQYCLLIVGDDENLFEFPDQDIELWVDVKDETDSKFNRIISDQGEPFLTFDNGLAAKIKTHFQLLLGYNSGTEVYADVTKGANDIKQSVGFFYLDGNEFIFSSPDRFWGIYFDMTLFSTLGATFSIHYSIGGELFSSDFSSLIEDSTEGFTKSGYIKWSNIPTWAVNNITPNNYTQYKGYMVKIIKTGGANEFMAARQFLIMNRAQGEKGDFLEFRVSDVGLSKDNVSDNIIIKNTITGWKWGMWPNNITASDLITRLLDRSHYINDKREITDIVVNTIDKTFNIWGTPPRPLYPYKPTAMYIDWNNETIYIAAELEIWYATFTSSWMKLCDLSGQVLIDTDVNKDKITKLTKLNDVIWMLVLDEDNKDGLTAKTFTYNITSKIITKIGEEENIYIGKWQSRDGLVLRSSLSAGNNYYRIIGGQVHLGDGAGFGFHRSGENLCFAYRHKVFCNVLNKLIAMYPANGIEGIGHGFPEWYFQELFGTQSGGQENGGAFYNTQTGYFYVQNNSISNFDWPSNYQITFEYGSIGCILIYSDLAVNFVSFQKKLHNSEIYFVLTNIINGAQYNPALIRNKAGDIPIAYISTSLGYTLWAFTQFKEYDGINKNYSYLSKASVLFNDWKKVVVLDLSDSIIKDITDQINNEERADNLFVINGYKLVFGHERKIKSFSMDLEQAATNVYEVYYSIEGGVWKQDNTIIQPTDSMHFTRETYGVDMPDDWAYHPIFGYALAIKITSGAASVDLISSKPTEQIIWGSANEVSDDQRIEIINMGLDSINNIVFGCAFNRDNSGSYPFQWCLFSFNLNTEVMSFIRTAESFIFEGTYVYKNFVFNNDEGLMYAYAENIRYKDAAGFLISINWNDGNPIITKVGHPDQSDWGTVDEMQYNNGKLFGLTKGNNNILWELSNSYSPRIELVEYDNDSSFTDVISDLAMLANFYYMITSERLIRFKQRENIDGSIELIWDLNMTDSNPLFSYWNNFYDAITVDWTSKINKTKGNRKRGYDGWLKNSFSLKNPLIQNTHIANVIADIYYNFFSNFRIQPERIKTSLLHHIEVMDGMTINMPSKIADIDKTISYVITSIELTSTKQLIIKGLERKL